jgi:hypothetical protein
LLIAQPVEIAYRRPALAESAPPRAQTASPPPPAPGIDLERLSRDVWEQLDKRLRIERERRGRG